MWSRSSNCAKITDFGSARVVQPSEVLQHTMGTPTYMAPEQIQGNPYNGFKADLWALGVCLYEFVFGEVPY